VPAQRGDPPDVRAAGGVVWRPNGGKAEVAIVHRPRYDDWSLPKGKLEAGETSLAAAAREVREELGSHASVSRRIGAVTYDTTSGRKCVTYWVMRHLDGTFEPTDEVDAVEWLRPNLAGDRLTYATDRRVLADFNAVPIPDAMIVLLRHAKAGRRAEWRGADKDRPLDATGLGQARRLVPLLSLFAPERIVSAEPARCVESVQPLADHLGLAVQIEPVFGDDGYAASAAATEDALLALAKPGRVTVVCSQGTAIPGLIDALGRGLRESDTRKGAFWVLSIVDGTVVSFDYYEDAVRA
jgi:8-oxo-dGTP diphosphatase